MQIGRRVYYDKATGNVLVDTGEMQGGVEETTREHDFQTYVELAKRIPETVGVIKLAYGELRNEFNLATSKRVDVTKPTIDSSAIVFDFTPQVQEELALEKTLQEKVTILETENTNLKTISDQLILDNLNMQTQIDNLILTNLGGM